MQKRLSINRSKLHCNDHTSWWWEGGVFEAGEFENIFCFAKYLIFRQNMSNYIFCEIHNGLLRTVKFKIFWQNIYKLYFRVLQLASFKMIYHLSAFYEFGSHQNFQKMVLNGHISRKSLVKSQNQNIFEEFKLNVKCNKCMSCNFVLISRFCSFICRK